MKNQAEDLAAAFRQKFGETPRIFRSPGRVNLIGEHTDYNDGFVMPAAIGLYAWLAIAPRGDRQVIVQTRNLAKSEIFDLDALDPAGYGRWSDYVRGVAVVLEQAGHRLRGASMMVQGEVPLGSGLSSSAALEVVTAFGMLAVSAIELSRVEMARFCQRAENEVVGVRCGIMDQLASACGAADRALLLDCRSLEYELQPLPEQARLVIANTMVRHDLASGEYNRRRAECEEAVAHLARRLPGVKALRDVTPAQLAQHGEGLAERPRKRARHVVAENERVAQASEALRGGDIARFGRLMAASHNSLRDDYEVSCKELDLMVGFANEVEGVYGSRMTGGGFGGCTISLVAHDRVAEFERHVVPRYRRATGFHPWIYTCSAVDGAEEVAV